MPVYALGEKYPVFPPPENASEEGLLAIGGMLTPEWLVEAYSSGVFPWFNEGDPILWWSVEPRSLLFPKRVHVQKSMKPYLNSNAYRFCLDRNFSKVIEYCAKAPGRGKNHTWLTPEMIDAYEELHRLGLAHSAEIYKDEELVGGLYGVSLGKAFFGESMFSLAKNSSKLSLIKLCRFLHRHDFDFIDCQVHTDHLERMGAQPHSRADYMKMLNAALKKPTLQGKWHIQ